MAPSPISQGGYYEKVNSVYIAHSRPVFIGMYRRADERIAKTAERRSYHRSAGYRHFHHRHPKRQPVKRAQLCDRYEDTEDRINHGTAVASVIFGCESAEVIGIAPEVALVPLVVADKVDGETKSVTPDVLAGAIRDSVDKYGACIVSVSLGIKKDDAAVKEAVAYVQKQGALVICAAGNEGDSKDLYYPAAYDGVLTVGSHDKDLKVSNFTQQNGTVDILAPGEDIWLASRNGKTYGAKGTSYATGFVSGTAALLWQTDRTQTPEEISQAILSSAQTVDGWKILTSPLPSSEKIPQKVQNPPQ